MDEFEKKRVFKGDKHLVQDLAMAPNQQWIAYGGKEGFLRIYDLINETQYHEFPRITASIEHIVISP